MKDKSIPFIHQSIPIHSLVVYRMLFALLILFGAAWSFYKNDWDLRFVAPQLYFSYWEDTATLAVSET
ncbi:MAG: hypothetical protein MK212_16820 [Saprospiraceae bacterium]|nr:hypothetical protein [Saprospiraceae bacterium]